MENPKIHKKKRRKLGSYPYGTVIFSSTLALLVIGLLIELMLHAGRFSEVVRENFEIHVYLNNNLTQNERVKINKVLASRPYILKKNGNPQIEFISREEAEKRYIKRTGNKDFKEILGESPVRASYAIRVKSEYIKEDKLQEIKKDIEDIYGVFEVDYLKGPVHVLNQNIKKAALVLGGLALILILAVIMLINNTIKLALYSQRFLIRSMQLVGAKRGFIQRPFLGRAALLGIVSGLLASGCIYGVIYYAYSRIPDLRLIAPEQNLLIVSGLLIVIGILLAVISTWRAIAKYLKMSLDELY